MKNVSISSLNKEQFDVVVRLYRYVFWADLLRMQFETACVQDQQAFEPLLHAKQNTLKPKVLEAEMYICLWFGVLYTAIEGWPTLRLNEPQIEALLGSPFKNLLRNFRNTTFDSDEFDDDRIQSLIATGQESINWAKKVTLEFKLFFENILSSSYKGNS